MTPTDPPPKPPHKTKLFRATARLSKLRFKHQYENAQRPELAIMIFVLAAGTTSLGTIAAFAYFLSAPLLFPSLAPSAFIAFYTPMAPAASPRTIILSHTSAILTGLFITWLIPSLPLPHSEITRQDLNILKMLEIMFIMASISLIMVIGHFAHPPAAATALLPAMGYLTGFTEAIGLIVSTALLAFEAYVFNRLLGGLPYPRWHSDSTVSIRYGRLGGSPPSDPDESYAEALQKNLFAPKTDDSASKD